MCPMKFPDTVLEKLTCSRCTCYLSMAPIGVKPNGLPVCSHCSHQLNISTPQSIVRCCIYEEVASLFVFPCRYQAWGCLYSVPFDQTEEHEGDCIYRTYSCPVNIYSECEWRGPVSLLCQHYNSEHPHLYLADSKFELKVDFDEELYRLVKIEDILFLLQTKCMVEENKIWFNVMYFGSTNSAQLVQYNIKLNGDDTKQKVKLENKNPHPVTYIKLKPSESLEVDLKALLSVLKHPKALYSQWTITIAKELKEKLNYLKKHSKQEFYYRNEMITCPFCRICMTPPIFRCAVGHITCLDCKGPEKVCRDCQMNNMEFVRAFDLENLATSVLFQCSWRNCTMIYPFNQIREHEWECLKKLYICPCCDKRIGTVFKVPEHFRNKHCDVDFIDEKGPSYSFTINVKNQDIYVFLQKEFIRIQVIQYNNGGHLYAKIVVSHHISPRFWHCFKCEVKNNRKGLKHRFNGFSNSYVVTQHIPKESYAHGLAYFTIQLDINEWIPFDYPFKDVEIKNVSYDDKV